MVLHKRLIAQSGGSPGLRDLGALKSSVAQPRTTFGGKELYPIIVEKASALGFSIILNHPFMDGNKRTGHAAIEVFLVLNGFEIDSPTNDQEETILQVASGIMSREDFTNWLKGVIAQRK